MAPCNGTQQWHHVQHPAMAFWCHVQCAKVVRRPPPLLEVRTPIAIAIWGIRVGENLGWNSETCTVNCRAFKLTNLHLKIASLEDEWVFFWAPVFQVWCVVSFRECMTWSHPAEKDKWWIGRIECSQKTRHFSLANSHIVQLSSLPVWNR